MERYREPHRLYHDVRHLREVLDAVELLADQADNPEAVRWAAWFHDAVYQIGATDNVERSAQLAERELADRPFVAEVARLVRLTESHKAVPGDRNGAVLCDADLRILATGPARYAEYIADVRAEHVDATDAEFAHGRSLILEQLLNGPVFHTRTARLLWERHARANLTSEVARLRAPA